MTNRSLKLLVAPGLPKQHAALQGALGLLQSRVSLNIFDCVSQQEAFDAIPLFLPDCVVMDADAGDFSGQTMQRMYRRLAKTQPEHLARCHFYLLTDKHLPTAITDIPLLQLLPKNQLQEDVLHERLYGSFTHVNLTVPKTNLIDTAEEATTWATRELGYQWTGKPTLPEQTATRDIYGEERYRRLVHNALDLTCVVEADGFIKYASASAERILGIKGDDLAGRYVQDYLLNCRRSNINRFFSKNKAQGGLTEITIMHPDGNARYLEVSCTDLTDDTSIKAFVISARDITARYQAEETLRYQARLLTNIREAVIGLDTHQCVTYMNAAAEKLYRITQEQAKGHTWQDLYQVEWMHPEEEAFMHQSLQEAGLWQGEMIQHTRSGRRLHVELSITERRADGMERPGTIIVVRDIKDRKAVENFLHESENRYRNLVNVSSDLVWNTKADGSFAYVSPRVTQLLGYSADEILGKQFYDFLPKGGENQAEIVRLLKHGTRFSFVQVQFLHKDGRVRTFEVSGIPQHISDGAFSGYQGVIRDVTERIEAQENTLRSLREKETLIKEIHHRVKNNMQIVSSLLFLQTQFIKDPDMLNRLQESQDRIRSMALVHEKLYQSSDLSRIDFQDYLDTLVNHITNTYRNRNIQVVKAFRRRTISIALDTAIPCGLIINELVSNAFKHAFPDGQQGRINVELAANKGGQAILIIQDNGIGIADLELGHYEETSLGMQLVTALTKQLQASLHVQHAQPGTRFTLTFNLG